MHGVFPFGGLSNGVGWRGVSVSLKNETSHIRVLVFRVISALSFLYKVLD